MALTDSISGCSSTTLPVQKVSLLSSNNQQDKDKMNCVFNANPTIAYSTPTLGSLLGNPSGQSSASASLL